MAKPIKETPILLGEEAIKFLENKEKNKDKRVDEKARKRIKSNFDKLNTIADF